MLQITKEGINAVFSYDDANGILLTGNAYINSDGSTPERIDGGVASKETAIVGYYSVYTETTGGTPKISLNNVTAEYIGLVSTAIADCITAIEEHYKA